MKNGEILLEDLNGKVISMSTNEAGNFWTYAVIGSNPLAIASHSGKTVKLYSDGADGKLIPAPSHDSTAAIYMKTPDTDPRHVYHNVSIAIDALFHLKAKTGQ